MEIKKKICDYIKQNKLYVFTIVVGLIMFIIQMNYVVLYADDLMLGNVAKGGMSAAIEHLKYNYVNWGGGPTPFIAIIFLFFDIKVWKIFNCIMVIASLIMIVKMVSNKTKINKGIIAIVFWICVYSLNIWISRETLYWLDGNLAYVLTTFQLLVYFYYLYSRLIMKTKCKKYDYILLPITAFFAGWSGPQAGAITVIISVILLLWVKLINKEKIKPIYIISLAIGLLGFLVYYLAPGNNARLLSAMPEFSNYSILEKIEYRLDSVWGLLFDFIGYKFASIPCYLYIVIALISIVSIKMIRQEKNKKIATFIKICDLILILFIILNFAITINCDETKILTNNLLTFSPILENVQNGTFSIKMLIPYAITTIIMALTTIITFYISYNEKNPLLFLVVICALLGQGMMLLSPYSPFRSAYITVFLLWIAVAYMITLISKNNISVIWLLMAIVAIMYEFKFALLLAIIYLIFKSIYDVKDSNSNKLEYIVTILFFGILALNSYQETLKGYKINYNIYNENVSRINEFKEKQSTSQKEERELKLLLPEKEYYGFTPLIGVPWVEEVAIDYFELENVKLLPETLANS